MFISSWPFLIIPLLHILESAGGGGELPPDLSERNPSFEKSDRQIWHSLHFQLHKNTFRGEGKQLLYSKHPLAELQLKSWRRNWEEVDPGTMDPSVLKGLEVKWASEIRAFLSPGRKELLLQLKLPLAGIPKEKMSYYSDCDLLQQAFKTFRLQVKETVLLSRSPEEARHYLQTLQRELVNLRQTLFSHLSLSQKTKGLQANEKDALLLLCYFTGDQALFFLETEHSSYLDNSLPLSHSLVQLHRPENDEKRERIKTLLEKSSLREDFLFSLLLPLQSPEQALGSRTFNRKELDFRLAYLEAFYTLALKNDTGLEPGQVWKILYGVNYNSEDIVARQLRLIQQELGQAEGALEQIRCLYRWHKQVNQYPVAGPAFDPLQQSLKLQVSCWLEEEIHFFQQAGSSKKQPGGLVSVPEIARLQSGLTVAQLALFFKLQMEAGLLLHKSPLEIFQHISGSYQTSKVQGISVESIKNKFYTIDPGTMEAVKSLIIGMLNLLKELGERV